MSRSAHFSFQVPQPYRAILRSFSYEPTILFDPVGTDPISASLTTGQQAVWSAVGAGNWTTRGTEVPNYGEMFLGQESGVIPCFVVIESGDFVNLLLSFSDNYVTLTGGGTATLAGYGINISMYGQLLLSTGRSINFEMSHEIRPKPVYLEKAAPKYETAIVPTPTKSAAPPRVDTPRPIEPPQTTSLYMYFQRYVNFVNREARRNPTILKHAIGARDIESFKRYIVKSYPIENGALEKFLKVRGA